MNFDKVFLVLGESGSYQRRICFWICLLYISNGIQTMIPVFLLGVPDHRCAIPGIADSYNIQGDDHQIMVDSVIPYTEHARTGRDYSRCVMAANFVNTTVAIIVPTNMTSSGSVSSSGTGTGNVSTTSVPYSPRKHFPNQSNSTGSLQQSDDVGACSKWVYSDKDFRSTFTSQLNLVCGKASFRAHAVMAFMFGFLIGSFTIGNLADTLGRKRALMLAIVLHTGSGIPLAFSPSLTVFVILRCINGMSCGGMVSVAFSTAMEFVGPTKRVAAGLTFQLFWAGGISLLSGLAYFVRNWQYLQLAVAVPTLFFLTYFWLMPESPRWLLQKGRQEEAMAVLRHAAAVNQTTMPDDIFEKEEGKEADTGCVPIWHLFSSRTMAVRTLIVWLNWLATYFAYLGLSLNAGGLAGNIYLNFFFLSVVEFVAYTFSLLFLNRLGRKVLYIGTIVVGGLACLLTILPVVYGGPDYQWVTVVLAVVGKTGASAAAAVIWVYSAELFPTVVRTSAMGSSAMMGRVGGAISPYIADLSHYVTGPFAPALPLIVFGAVCVISGILSLRLPETMNMHLPETIDDAKNFKRRDIDITITVKE